MDDTLPVCGIERIGDLDAEVQYLFNGKRASRNEVF